MSLQQQQKTHKLFQFFLSNKFDILMIKEIRKLTEDSYI